MEDLQAIWNKLNELQKQVGALIDEQAIDHNLDQLQQRESARLREARWLRGMIVGTVTLLTGMVVLVAFLTHQPVTWGQILGSVCIGQGMYWMLWQFQRTQIQDAQGFIAAAREKLLLRRKLLILAPLVYALLLLGGMHLLLHPYISLLPAYWGIIGGSYGFTLGILGAGMGIQWQKFERDYGPVLDRFERFLAA